MFGAEVVGKGKKGKTLLFRTTFFFIFSTSHRYFFSSQMDSSLRAVTVETPSQEQEYIDEIDTIKRLSTSSRSRGNRRSVTFADASTQGGFEDRVNNAMQLGGEEKTVDDHDEIKKNKRIVIS